jgi:hypothetical protein
MAQCPLLDKDKDILGSLEVGQAVVKLQGRIARPFQITVPEFIIQKGSITDEYIQEHKRYAISAESEENHFDKRLSTTKIYLKDPMGRKLINHV